MIRHIILLKKHFVFTDQSQCHLLKFFLFHRNFVNSVLLSSLAQELRESLSFLDSRARFLSYFLLHCYLICLLLLCRKPALCYFCSLKCSLVTWIKFYPLYSDIFLYGMYILFVALFGVSVTTLILFCLLRQALKKVYENLQFCHGKTDDFLFNV